MTAFTPLPVPRADGLSTARRDSLRSRFQRFLAERRRRGRLARELAALTERDLTDLGIGRADFRAIIRGTYRR